MDFLSNVGRREQVTVNEVGRFVTLGNKSLNGNERNVLYKNTGGGGEALSFADAGFVAGVDCREDGRGAIPTDIDGDGDLDLIVQSFGRAVRLLMNQGQDTGSWLQIKLRGDRRNIDAIGARVVAEVGGRRFVREVTTSAGYVAGQSMCLHFGLGDAKRVDRLVVRWPGGQRTVKTGVAVNQRLELALPRK